ncbi:hypothetical protein F3Y22_tig00110895pilonHSYRG00017 [Hibiscus syriacus]|uniref:isoleucine--tRNA ligase n=1 Tax=Hibiscus syriacus TaxID=106335 RepID=A0A6A2ZFG6_HIBSY|nr:hypothetical protein F3Y22_tig00110895pilonHSYRG00017 [Hibiscus syriacus]
MEEVCEGKEFCFPSEEERILSYWYQTDAFKGQLDRTENMPKYVFYDGPPFASGEPHYGHVLIGTIKDIFTRYKSMTGHHVIRRFGWDCHGIPVEQKVDEKLEIKRRDQILKMGIDKYNEECRNFVIQCSEVWEKTVTRSGRWIDFKNGYKTMDMKYMESVWWVFAELYKKKLTYKAFKVMPYSTGCKTPLSNNEVDKKENYKSVSDPAIMVAFPIVGDPDNAAFVAWTTTPWTLPSNLALCVNANFVYVKVRNKYSGKIYVVAESRLSELPTEKPKSNSSNESSGGSKKSKSKGTSGEKTKDSAADSFEVLEKFSGASLVGKKYEPLFNYFLEFSDVAFRVIADNYVKDDSGTGIVHCAPAFGEDDYRVCTKNEIINKDENLIVAVDDDGCFTGKIADFSGHYVKDADKAIIEVVKAKGRLVKYGTFTHDYPFCPRSDTPLIYRALPSWFVKVEELKEQLLDNNKQTYWVPGYVKDKRFHNWLENARDWAISRSRFWGTPIPVWISEDGEEEIVMDSVEKLERLSGAKVFDLHRDKIDHITIPSSRGPEFGVLRRIDDVRFYTLMVLSTALFGKPAFRNLICTGLVLADDGKKMSKRLKNYPEPTDVINDYGADALRLYLMNSPVVRAETLRFKKEGVFRVVKDVFLPWYNAYRFLVQNAKRLEHEGSAPFVPIAVTVLQMSSNVLDQWINSATQSLVHFVREEMDAYRLYTVLLTSCKVMAPFTPFFTEVLYQNMRKVSDGAEESIHFCRFPQEEGKRGDRIEESVTRMMKIIDLARNIRERHIKPLKTPLREMIVVHPDEDFLDDIAGRLREYVLEELNIRSLVTCKDTLKYASVRAEPDFGVLGKRLGKSMGAVAKEVKAMSQEDILAFEKAGEVTIATHCLKLTDIKLVREFKHPDGMTDKEDAAGDGDVLVVLDLRPDESLFEAGIAREVVNRIQKHGRKAGLEPTDMVGVYFESLDEDKSVIHQILNSQENYIRDALDVRCFPPTVVLCEEIFQGIYNMSFKITLEFQRGHGKWKGDGGHVPTTAWEPVPTTAGEPVIH